VAKLLKFVLAKYKNGFNTFIVSFDAKIMFLTKTNDFFSNKATVAFIEIIFINKHRDTVKHS